MLDEAAIRLIGVLERVDARALVGFNDERVGFSEDDRMQGFFGLFANRRAKWLKCGEIRPLSFFAIAGSRQDKGVELGDQGTQVPHIADEQPLR